MGTPGFAVPSLAALIDAGFNVVGVVTAPDRPAGRGQQIQESEVKKYALSKNLPILQPEKLKNPDFINELRALKAELQVVVAFRMLPEIIWNMPVKGTINLHASLLPQYRGAAPINHVIINGEKETGVTTFFLQHEIDTGNIIQSASLSISDDENAGKLHDRLMELGAEVLVNTVKLIENNNYNSIPQREDEIIKFAPKLTKEFCRINWNKPTVEVYNHIRGLSPYPTAFTTIKDKTLKVFSSKMQLVNNKVAPGTFESDGKTFLKFKTADGYLELIDVQLEGKKRMDIESLLRGFKID